MKKFIALLLALLIVATIVPFTVFAEAEILSPNTGDSVDPDDSVDSDDSYVSSSTETGGPAPDSSSGEERSTPKVTFYTIRASAGEGGSIEPEGEVDARRKFDKTFTITADDGYIIADVTVDGQSVGATGEYTFVDVRRSHRIHAEFVLAPAAAPEESSEELVEEPVEETPTEEPEPEAPASQEPAQEQTAEPEESEDVQSVPASEPAEAPAEQEETETEENSFPWLIILLILLLICLLLYLLKKTKKKDN